MSEPAGGALPAPQLAEVISSLENCEWALTRAREAITSMVAALRGQPQQATESKVKEEDDEDISFVKTEPDSDIEVICVRVCYFQSLPTCIILMIHSLYKRRGMYPDWRERYSEGKKATLVNQPPLCR